MGTGTNDSLEPLHFFPGTRLARDGPEGSGVEEPLDDFRVRGARVVRSHLERVCFRDSGRAGSSHEDESIFDA